MPLCLVVLEPATVVQVPGMVPPREANYAVPLLPPHSATTSKISSNIKRKDKNDECKYDEGKCDKQ
ncbi:hypothetical protein E2C01_003845 [Portunus trituberculatus]|uniref:Uncharacterized protein n=1 Tax=Portunus trituberculatus TaxID=210409 RepID=A0A5B7CS93_PORTR|nr:hypothetical protein [Portunus trituberculatus]